MELRKNELRTPEIDEKIKEDYELVKKAIDGDQKSFAALMDKYQGAIYNMMFKMVSNREDASDLTLEAFGKAFNKLESYAPRYAFSTWLFKIAINNSIDHIRKKKLAMLSIDDPINEFGVQDFSGSLKSSGLNPEESIIKKQRLRLIRTLLKKLSHKYRLMLELRFFEGLSYDEIAVELDIPLGTVKAQLFRAKQLLQNHLEKPGAEAFIDQK